jgi:NAD(P)-dependent dehydrogenase (short-subunit alcohol dehydrogenase family)
MSTSTADPFDVQGRVVVLTGGLGQLGLQFTRALVERGARVAIFDAGAAQAHLAARLGPLAASAQVLCLPVDITRRSDLEAGLRQVQAAWGAPHALVNNAALDSPPGAPAAENGPFEHYPEESWDAILRVNVKGVFLACQVVGGALAEAGRGSVINIASTYGLVSPDQRLYEYRRAEGAPFFKPAAYATSKSALLNLTRYLATYWAPRGVRVNTLTFGGVFNHQDPRFLEQYCARVPLGRMAREDEYNGAVIFLISEASSYMTGSNMILDGGWTAW